MKEPITHLKVATSRVLETMFFEPVQFAGDTDTLGDWFCSDQALVGATLNFAGPNSGSYILLMPGRLAKRITVNFLGLCEAEVNMTQESDTAKEALNMIGGHMLSLFDVEGQYQLGIPEIISENDLDAFRHKKGQYVLMETGEDRLAAGVMLD
jgi:hypothetical protein